MGLTNIGWVGCAQVTSQSTRTSGALRYVPIALRETEEIIISTRKLPLIL